MKIMQCPAWWEVSLLSGAAPTELQVQKERSAIQPSRCDALRITPAVGRIGQKFFKAPLPWGYCIRLSKPYPILQGVSQSGETLAEALRSSSTPSLGPRKLVGQIHFCFSLPYIHMCLAYLFHTTSEGLVFVFLIKYFEKSDFHFDMKIKQVFFSEHWHFFAKLCARNFCQPEASVLKSCVYQHCWGKKKKRRRLQVQDRIGCHSWRPGLSFILDNWTFSEEIFSSFH